MEEGGEVLHMVMVWGYAVIFTAMLGSVDEKYRILHPFYCPSEACCVSTSDCVGNQGFVSCCDTERPGNSCTHIERPLDW